MSKRRHQPRTGTSYRRREPGGRDERLRFLIVCEGEQTEPNYVKKFQAPRVVIQVDGAGDHTKSLIAHAQRLADQDEYDEVWCVMDRDSFPPERFNAALEMAQTRGIFVAYSNEAFELWYILHYDYLQAGLGRDEYKRILTARLGEKYKKNSPDMYDKLRPLMPNAIRNARKLLEGYKPHKPEQDCPSTTVHLLVEKLMIHERP